MRVRALLRECRSWIFTKRLFGRLPPWALLPAARPAEPLRGRPAPLCCLGPWCGACASAAEPADAPAAAVAGIGDGREGQLLGSIWAAGGAASTPHVASPLPACLPARLPAASPYPEVGKTFSIITARVRPGQRSGATKL